MTREEIEQHAQEIENWLINESKKMRLDSPYNDAEVVIKLDVDRKAGFVNHILKITRAAVGGTWAPAIYYFDGSYDEAVLAGYEHISDTCLEFKVHVLRDWATIKQQVVSGIKDVNSAAETRDRIKAAALAAEVQREKSLCDSITSFEL